MKTEDIALKVMVGVVVAVGVPAALMAILGVWAAFLMMVRTILG